MRDDDLVRVRLIAVQVAVSAAVGAAALAACGGGDDAEPAGKSLARQYSCLSCHGPDGEGGTGPKWVGLFGSQVTLDDGTTVIADEEYIRTAVLDPSAQVREGVRVPMPLNPAVTADDLDLIIDYITSLNP